MYIFIPNCDYNLSPYGNDSKDLFLIEEQITASDKQSAISRYRRILQKLKSRVLRLSRSKVKSDVSAEQKFVNKKTTALVSPVSSRVLLGAR